MATGDTDIQRRVDEGVEIDIQIANASTLTEEPGMPGSSVKALVDCRDAARDDLHLRPGQTVMMLKVIFEHMIERQVLNLFELEMSAQLTGNQAEGTDDVGLGFATVELVGKRTAFGRVGNCWYPRQLGHGDGGPFARGGAGLRRR